jgi:cobalamin-dependent methionine synthase I
MVFVKPPRPFHLQNNCAWRTNRNLESISINAADSFTERSAEFVHTRVEREYKGKAVKGQFSNTTEWKTISG